MEWIKKILGIGKKNKTSDDKIVKEDKNSKQKDFQVPQIKKLPEEKIDWNRKIRECGICEDNINPDESMTKMVGYYFHKSCFAKAKRWAGF